MENITVDIITAEASLLVGGQASSVTAPGVKGTFQVLPGHTTFLTALETGHLTLEGRDGAQRFVINGGFCEVMPGHVRILADQALAQAGLDAAQVKQSLQQIEQELNDADPFSEQAEALRAEQYYLKLQSEISA